MQCMDSVVLWMFGKQLMALLPTCFVFEVVARLIANIGATGRGQAQGYGNDGDDEWFHDVNPIATLLMR
jgi:hypothetical protein